MAFLCVIVTCCALSLETVDFNRDETGSIELRLRSSEHLANTFSGDEPGFAHSGSFRDVEYSDLEPPVAGVQDD